MSGAVHDQEIYGERNADDSDDQQPHGNLGAQDPVYKADVALGGVPAGLEGFDRSKVLIDQEVSRERQARPDEEEGHDQEQEADEQGGTDDDTQHDIIEPIWQTARESFADADR